jgi:hypothetical protein
MGTRKPKKQSAKATLAEVTKEMAKPKVAMSARGHSLTFRNELLVVKNNVGK